MFKATEHGLVFTEEIELTEEDLKEIEMLFSDATVFQRLDKVKGVWADRGNGFGLSGFSIVDGV